MNTLKLTRGLVTLVLVLTAAGLVYFRYRVYFHNPWTRDGIVQAQVVEIASRVTGPLIRVAVQNNQLVRKGDLLFEIDPALYKAALDQANANLAQARAQQNEARDVAVRSERAVAQERGAVSSQALEQARDRVAAATAGVQAAEAAVAAAALRLNYTRIFAPQDGYIVNLTTLPGSQVVADTPLVALIVSDSFWVDSFFRETLIRDIRPGAQALVTLMSYPDIPLTGRVASVGWGIARTDGSTGEKLLPVVNPTFEWIRLAQRIPVRVELDPVPAQVKLRMGTTASVLVRVSGGTETGTALPTLLQ